MGSYCHGSHKGAICDDGLLDTEGRDDVDHARRRMKILSTPPASKVLLLLGTELERACAKNVQQSTMT